MKKAIPFSVACVLAVMLYSGCHKKKDEGNTTCRTCKATNGDFQLVDSASVCSDDAETAFRNRNSSRHIECK